MKSGHAGGMHLIAALRIAFAGLAFVAVTAALLPLHLPALYFDHKLARRIPHLWHRAMAEVLGLKVTPHGKLDERRPLMLVANHASWLDIVALSTVGEVAFIAKSEVRSWPVFGYLARWQRTVFVDRNARRTTGDQIDAIADRLDRGEIVVLFAEGTTSDGNRVLDFKSSLFGAARRAAAESTVGHVALQPVAIAYSRIHGLPMGRRHRPLASWPGDVALAPHLLGVLKEGAIDVDIHFGQAVEFDAASDRKAVSRAMRAEIAEMLAAGLRRS